jgi:3-methyladenine DNA glycosylase/8-oxoguanine DNA glycosylase
VISRTVRPPRAVDLRLTLGVLRRGRFDPCMQLAPGEVWRATRTPDGPATTHIRASSGILTMRAWGPGAAWAVDAFPALVGDRDDDATFEPRDGVVADLRRRLRGLRLCRTGAVVEVLVPTIIEQKVIGMEARRSYARLVRALGEPAPGPAGGTGGPRLLLPPDPAVLARTPSYVFHRGGIERKRADTIRLACSYARRLEELTDLPAPAAYGRLTALPGIGAWTAAEVAMVALGDADAVSVGDYHLPHHVAWALAGEARADDARMLELLEPYRGHRGRVIRLLVAGVPGPPRLGPRLPLNPIAAL